MNCTIVYYSARKTSFCEKALKKAFHEMGLNLISAVFATMRSSLGEELKKAFEACDVVFTVGGLEFEDNRSVRDIISQASAGSKPTLCRRLENPGGDDGYLLRAGSQLLVMLPDEPLQIEEMTRGVFADYIKTMNKQ